MLMERRPSPPALSKAELPDGKNKVLHIKPIHRLNCYIDEESASEIDTDGEDWLNWDGDIDQESKVASMEESSDNDSDPEMNSAQSFDEVLAAPIILGLIHPLQKSARIENRIISSRSTIHKPEKRKQK